MKHSDAGHFDTAVIGGGAAGLSAATVLARAHRQVAVIDSGRQSNLVSSASHAVFTRDGVSPKELYAIGRKQLQEYPTASVLEATVSAAHKEGGVFSLTLADGRHISASTLVLAQGIEYKLPNIPGLQELWGGKVWHCPFCHSYEATGKNILAILDASKAEHMQAMLPKWQIEARYVAPEKVREIIDLPEGIKAVFTDGSSAGFDEIISQTDFLPRDGLADQLGCRRADDGALEVDGMNMTSVDRIYSAGDQSSTLQQVNFAVAAGHLAAVGIMSRKEG